MVNRLLLAIIFACVGLQSQVADSHERGKAGHHASPASKPIVEPTGSARVTLHDLELVDQDRNKVRFKSDVISDRIVVIEFFYTSCVTICPVTSALLSDAQDRLGDQFGRDVWFVSITVDPVTDTPERIKTYSQHHQTQPGWVWITGKKALVDKVLKGLGAYAAEIDDHPSMLLVGDGRSGSWTRLFGLPDPEQVLGMVRQLLAARGKTTIPNTAEGGK